VFFSWDLHIGWLVLGGGALLAMTVLPRLLHRRPLSLPIVYVAVGFVVFEFSDALRGPRPLGDGFDLGVIQYVTELVVIISLVGAGMRIERRPGLVRWSSAWRLLAITMPITIVATALLGNWLAGLAVAPAILLGGVLAPTDPVLADDVQVSPPGEVDEEETDEVRFTLTAEAGLNDGLAFPFIHLAIAVAAAGATMSSAAGQWVWYDVGYRIVVGVVAGYVVGQLINRFGHRTGEFFRNQTSEGLFSLGTTLFVYGLTEIVNGYGFLAVFVAALVRGSDDHDYRREAHDFVEQIESVIVAFVLLGFGALLSEGILDALSWEGALIAVVLVFVIRPVAGWVSMVGRRLPTKERWSIAFFGIRGIGSLYYLAYGLSNADFGDAAPRLWAIVSFTILLSVAIHGVSASPTFRRLEDEAADTVGHTPEGDTPSDQENLTP